MGEQLSNWVVGGDWPEEASTEFDRAGDILMPFRAAQFALITALAPLDNGGLVVDLGCGNGTLMAQLLERYPLARALALDGSPFMRQAATERLAPFADRATIADFDLRRSDWRERLPAARCIVSSLVIHHLDGPGKQRLYRDLVPRLEEGGAFLIADLIEPVNDRVRAAYARDWDGAVLAAAREKGKPEAYAHFHQGWNHYSDPDVDFDMPSGLFEQLEWLRAAGLQQVDCFFLQSGHAVFGGYR